MKKMKPVPFLMSPWVKNVIFIIKRGILMAALLFFVVLSIWIYVGNKELVREGTEAKGIVIKVKNTFRWAYVRYRFKTERGSYQESSRKKYRSDGFLVGDTVIIEYVPDNPRNNRLIGLVKEKY